MTSFNFIDDFVEKGYAQSENFAWFHFKSEQEAFDALKGVYNKIYEEGEIEEVKKRRNGIEYVIRRTEQRSEKIGKLGFRRTIIIPEEIVEKKRKGSIRICGYKQDAILTIRVWDCENLILINYLIKQIKNQKKIKGKERKDD